MREIMIGLLIVTIMTLLFIYSVYDMTKHKRK